MERIFTTTVRVQIDEDCELENQTVIIKLPSDRRPLYLNGQRAVIRKKNIKNVVVDITSPLPAGSRYGRGLTIDPAHLVAVKPK